MLTTYLMLLESEKDKIRFEDIYKKEADGLLKYAMGLIKNASKAAAEDAVEEAFLWLIRNFHIYSKKEYEDIHRVLITVVRNKMVDWYRLHKREAEWLDSGTLFEAGSTGDNFYLIQAAAEKYAASGGPEQKIIVQEMFLDLCRLIQELPEGQRQVYLMCHYTKIKPKEIAKQLGISVKTVNQRLYRARLTIKECMMRYGYEERDINL